VSSEKLSNITLSFSVTSSLSRTRQSGSVTTSSAHWLLICPATSSRNFGWRTFFLIGGTGVDCEVALPLGQGSEIKAKHVAKGVGWWKNNEKRNNFRDLMLSFPTDTAGAGFAVVVDKKRHLKKYSDKAQNPVALGMTYLFERAEYHCRDNNSDPAALASTGH
jgi:hypothetical protein